MTPVKYNEIHHNIMHIVTLPRYTNLQIITSIKYIRVEE